MTRLSILLHPYKVFINQNQDGKGLPRSTFKSIYVFHDINVLVDPDSLSEVGVKNVVIDVQMAHSFHDKRRTCTSASKCSLLMCIEFHCPIEREIWRSYRPLPGSK